MPLFNWIPAFAGMTNSRHCHPRENGDPVKSVMFFKRILLSALLAVTMHAAVEPKDKFVVDNFNQLNKLIKKKKKLGKVGLELDHLFEDYVGNARDLLKILDQQNPEVPQNNNKELIEQIARHMGALQGLLDVMKKGSQPKKPFEYQHRRQQDQASGASCGDRPAKNVSRHDKYKEKESIAKGAKLPHRDEDEEALPKNIGN